MRPVRLVTGALDVARTNDPLAAGLVEGYVPQHDPD